MGIDYCEYRLKDERTGDRNNYRSHEQPRCGAHEQVDEIDETFFPGETFFERLDGLKLRKLLQLRLAGWFNYGATVRAVC